MTDTKITQHAVIMIDSNTRVFGFGEPVTEDNLFFDCDMRHIIHV